MLVTSFTTEEAVRLMDEGGVDAAVIHPPGWGPQLAEMAFNHARLVLRHADALRRRVRLHGPRRREHERFLTAALLRDLTTTGTADEIVERVRGPRGRRFTSSSPSAWPPATRVRSSSGRVCERV